MTVRTNYLANPSFEITSGLADNWMHHEVAGNYSITGTPVYSLVSGRTRGYAQRIQYTGVAGDSAGNLKLYLRSVSTANGTFASGDNCTMSFYYKGSISGVNLYIDAEMRTSADGQNGDYSTALTPSGSWQRATQFHSVPPVTGRVDLNIAILNIGTGDTIDLTIDDAMIEKVASVGAYFDGSYSATGYVYAWTGTANASTSTETPFTPSYLSIMKTRILAQGVM